MKKLTIVFCAALAAIAFIGLAGYASMPPPSTPDSPVIERSLNAVVVLKSGNSFGAGVVVSEDGVIVTNAHVARLNPPTARFRDGTVLPVKIEFISDNGADIALLRVDPPRPLEFVEIRKAPILVGEEVFAVGHPLGLEWVISWGHVSAIERVLNGAGGGTEDDPVVLLDVTTAPGNSGGGLFDTSGRLIGLPNAAVRGYPIGIAVSNSTICKLVSCSA